MYRNTHPTTILTSSSKKEREKNKTKPEYMLPEIEKERKGEREKAREERGREGGKEGLKEGKEKSIKVK